MPKSSRMFLPLLLFSLIFIRKSQYILDKTKQIRKN